MERTLVLLKPDAVQRGLVGRIIARFEAKGLQLVGLKLEKFPVALIRKHYEEHKGKPFYDDLVGFMTSGPVVAMVLQGKGAIEVTRKLIGATSSAKAEPGTIRGDLGMSFSNNLVHGSDGARAARRELALFFPRRAGIVAWTPVTEEWVYSGEELGGRERPGRAGKRRPRS